MPHSVWYEEVCDEVKFCSAGLAVLQCVFLLVCAPPTDGPCSTVIVSAGAHVSNLIAECVIRNPAVKMPWQAGAWPWRKHHRIRWKGKRKIKYRRYYRSIRKCRRFAL